MFISQEWSSFASHMAIVMADNPTMLLPENIASSQGDFSVFWFASSLAHLLALPSQLTAVVVPGMEMWRSGKWPSPSGTSWAKSALQLCFTSMHCSWQRFCSPSWEGDPPWWVFLYGGEMEYCQPFPLECRMELQHCVLIDILPGSLFMLSEMSQNLCPCAEQHQELLWRDPGNTGIILLKHHQDWAFLQAMNLLWWPHSAQQWTQSYKEQNDVGNGLAFLRIALQQAACQLCKEEFPHQVRLLLGSYYWGAIFLAGDWFEKGNYFELSWFSSTNFKYSRFQRCL